MHDKRVMGKFIRWVSSLDNSSKEDESLCLQDRNYNERCVVTRACQKEPFLICVLLY